MAVVLTVGITSGVPSSGTGTVSTIDNMLSSAGTPSSNVLTIQLSTTPSSASYPLHVGLVSTSAGVTTPGQAVMAGSLPVTMASNQTVIPVGLVPLSSAAGLTVSSVLLSTTTNATTLSTQARQLYKIEGFNISSLPAFAKLYNLSSTPTAGSSLVTIFYTIPNSTAGAGLATEYTNGVPFGTGLSYTVTSSMSSSDTTVLQTVNSVILSVYYK